MKKIIKSAKQIYNGLTEYAQQFGDYLYDEDKGRAYWEEDGCYYMQKIDDPEDNDLREVLDMLVENGYSDLDRALDFYDYGNSNYEQWRDYLEWFISENSDAEEIEAETEDYDTKEDFEYVAKAYRGIAFQDLTESIPAERRTEVCHPTDDVHAMEIECNGLAFTIHEKKDGSVILDGAVRAWDINMYDEVDCDMYDDVVLYEPAKAADYNMDVNMIPFASIIDCVKGNIISCIAMIDGLSIDPHFKFKFKPDFIDDIKYDAVALTRNTETEKPQLSFIEGSIAEPTLSADVDLDKFPIEELVRMFNSFGKYEN